MSTDDVASAAGYFRRMSTSAHRDTCMVRPHPWSKVQPTPGCSGCMPDAERALWVQLADEADAYLTTHLPDADLESAPPCSRPLF